MAKGAKTGGRIKGTPNKATAEIREIIRDMMDRQVPKMEERLEEIAKTNPAKAIELGIQLAEFVLPKLARHEVTGSEGEPLQVSIEIVRQVKGK